MTARSIDLIRYFPTRELAKAELASVEGAAATFPVAPSRDNVELYFANASQLLNRIRRLDVYFNILAADNTDDLAASTGTDHVDAARTIMMEKVERALLALSPADAIALKRHDARYGYFTDRAARLAGHKPSADGSAVLAATASPALTAYWKIYQKLDLVSLDEEPKADTKPATIGDRSTREAVWRARWMDADTKADTKAAILLAIVQQNEAIARLDKYPDAASAGYASRELDRETVNKTLDAVSANIALYRRWGDYQNTRIRQLGAINNPEPWDLSLLETGSISSFSFDDARRIIPVALAPLGPDYVQHFTALLAPGSGRVDIAPSIGTREPGGFSVSAPQVPTGLYMAVFSGTLDNMRVVIHEGGHAVAAQYANEAETPPEFVKGPNWLAESYAILNESLLYRYLADHSATPADRTYYQTALVDNMMFQIFGSGEEATIEQGIYDGVAHVKIQSAADLNATTYSTMRKFEPWSDATLHASSSLWSKKQLMYEDPFYLVNYLFAGMIAIDLYKEAMLHPDTFPERYRTLLRHGYDAPPMDLLAPLLGKNVSTATLTNSAFSVMREELAKLSPEKE